MVDIKILLHHTYLLYFNNWVPIYIPNSCIAMSSHNLWFMLVGWSIFCMNFIVNERLYKWELNVGIKLIMCKWKMLVYGSDRPIIDRSIQHMNLINYINELLDSWIIYIHLINLIHELLDWWITFIPLIMNYWIHEFDIFYNNN